MRLTRSFQAIAALGIAGLLIYSNSFQGSFHLDDYRSIVANPAIQRWGDFGALWHFWPMRFLTYLSFAVNYHFGGLEVWGYHALNFLIHVGSAVLVRAWVLLIYQSPAMRKHPSGAHAGQIAFFTAIFFLVHPLQTQAVTYVVQRATSLATFFYLAALCLYCLSRLKSGPAQKYYSAGAWVAALAAMFSKEMAITLPLMILMTEFFFFREDAKPSWKKSLIFLGLLPVIPLTMALTQSVDFSQMKRVAAGAPLISSGDYFITQMSVLGRYLRLLFFPMGQNLDHDVQAVQNLWAFKPLAGIGIWALIFFTAKATFSKHRVFSFALVWFILTLLPESSFLPIRDLFFEHRLYLPMVGFSLFVVAGVYSFVPKGSLKSAVLMLGACAVLLGFLTYQRNHVWKNELSLWTDVLLQSPNKSRPYNERGLALKNAGDLDKAIADYDRAIAIDKDNPIFYCNRASAHGLKANADLAIADYKKALELLLSGVGKELAGQMTPEIVHRLLAQAYYNRGNEHSKAGRIEAAIADYDLSIETDASFSDAFINRGILYQRKDDYAQAISDYNHAIYAKPDNGAAYANRAIVYFLKKNYSQSLMDVKEAKKLGVEAHPDFLKNLDLAVKALSSENS